MKTKSETKSETKLEPVPQLDPAPSLDIFRRLALAMPGAVESSHMEAPDFRVRVGTADRIFVTLAYGARGWATLKLTPEQQAHFLTELSTACIPAPGGWGRMGMTLIRTDAAEDVLRGAITTAYDNVASKQKPRKDTPAKHEAHL